MIERVDLLDLSPDELTDYVSSLGEEKYRASQIARWIYKTGAKSFDEMTDLPKALRLTLEDRAQISSITADKVLLSSDGTRKYLFRLNDGSRVETVLIPDCGRYTLCISSQVGCRMGCTFCLTGTVGRIRNLKTSEIINQLLFVRSDITETITNIVFMGMGEPLDNFDNTVRALKILTHQAFIGMSPRRITVSTSGLVPMIEKLGREAPVNLSISLNAPNDELRSKIMPVNKKYPLRELLDAGRRYPFPRGKRLTFEYVLLQGVNDSPTHARELARLLSGVDCMINLIPFNEATPLPYKTPDAKSVATFQQILISSGLRTLIRKSKGRDILGACGQLAALYPPRMRKGAGLRDEPNCFEALTV